MLKSLEEWLPLTPGGLTALNPACTLTPVHSGS
jgi:hypothetical protein